MQIPYRLITIARNSASINHPMFVFFWSIFSLIQHLSRCSQIGWRTIIPALFFFVIFVLLYISSVRIFITRGRVHLDFTLDEEELLRYEDFRDNIIYDDHEDFERV